MASWVYVFSKFTPEALLFEALAICVLVCAYTAFWILRKHKFGSASEAIPASLVRNALDQLMGDAETLRTQLFGILGGASPGGAHRSFESPSLSDVAQRSSSTAIGGDPELQKKMAALEARMSEQAQVLERIQQEKVKLEQDLAQAKTGGGGGSADSKLKDKVEALEARLAEYSVIEDDLANLKRLQQENAQLKASVANRAAVAPSPSAATPAAPALAATAAAPTAPEPAAPVLAKAEPATNEVAEKPKTTEANPLEAATAGANAEALFAPSVGEDEVETVSPDEIATQLAAGAAVTAPEATPAATEPNFESLVDSVEKSLNIEGTAPTQNPTTPTPSAPAAPSEKSDEDLIAEFEKMLNS
jgi:hypothetical protein